MVLVIQLYNIILYYYKQGGERSEPPCAPNKMMDASSNMHASVIKQDNDTISYVHSQGTNYCQIHIDDQLPPRIFHVAST